MSAKPSGKRIFIDDSAYMLLAEATKSLKSQNCKISDSILASEIISHFLGGRTENFMHAMESKYFDQRRHLQKILSTHKDSESITKELAKIRTATRRRGRRIKSVSSCEA